MRMENRICLITAAASGMGRAGAIEFAREGAKVAVVDRDLDGARACVDDIEASGGNAVAIQADLTSIQDSEEIVAKTVCAFGGLNVVWNHVGHPGPGKVEEIDQNLLQLAIDLNLRSVMATTGAAIPEMRKSGGKCAFVFTSSTGGLVGSRYSPVYSAMKHGVIGYMKALALRLAPEGIRSNAVCPGPIDTPMFGVFGSRPDQPQRSREEVRQATEQNTVPMRRLGQPEEVAKAALFLASDDASYITGAALAVDGGITAG